MTYEEIKKANESLTPMDIKGKDYINVAQRVQAFRQIMPNGAIVPEMLKLEDGVVTFKATVFDERGVVLAVGHAQEKETSSYINKTSFIENCETSAVGRALGFLGIGSETSIASLEEVANAINNQPKKDAVDEAFEKVMSYEQALDVCYQGRKLRDIYKTDRAFIPEIYKQCSLTVKKAIDLIEVKIKEGKK